MKQKKRFRKRRHPVDKELKAIDEEVGKLVAQAGKGYDVKPAAEMDSFTRKLMEDERAFLNPEEWGIDLRPIVEESLGAPADPSVLSDTELSSCLGRLVDLLAQYHLCLTTTNHLTDRDLYREIMTKVLAEPVGIGPDPVGGLLYHECCPCDSDAYLMYYADEDNRQELAAEFDLTLPDKRPLVSDRDIWIERLAESYRFEPLPQRNNQKG